MTAMATLHAAKSRRCTIPSQLALAAVWIGSLAIATLSRPAFAQSIIRNPGAHPQYVLELEPHLLLGPTDPPGNTVGTGVGAGLRATIPIVQNGFVQTINNSVGISFGFDWLHYTSGRDVAVGYCGRWILGPNNTRICTQLAGPSTAPANYIFLPVAMQWNFWLLKQLSVFGEPGFVIYHRKAEFEPDSSFGVAPLFQLGGRWHFSDIASLTFRFGYPTFSLGVSFLL
jgi:hypothetical protein